MHHPIERSAHILAFVNPVMEQWLEREIAKLFHPEGLIQQPITP